jgi:histone deacetylase 1/2
LFSDFRCFVLFSWDLMIIKLTNMKIWLSCAGADALVGDRVGTFSLTVEGHAEAVRYVKSFNLPTLVLGGGGYTKAQVSRAWTLATSHLVGSEPLPDPLPDENPYADYYLPEYRLRYNYQPRWQNENTKQDLERVKATVLDGLKALKSAPGAGTAAGTELRAPEALLPEVPLGHDGEERLKAYAQGHFHRYMRCVEQGVVDPYSLL